MEIVFDGLLMKLLFCSLFIFWSVVVLGIFLVLYLVDFIFIFFV